MPRELFATKISYNVGGTFGGRNSDRVVEDDLVRMIEEHKPLIVTLQEVWDRKEPIRRAAHRTGYRPVIPDGAASHNAILLRPDTVTVNSGVIPLSARRWVGRKVAGAKRHGMARANDLVWVRYNVHGLKWIDGVVHLVPSHFVRLARLLARIQVAGAATWLGTRKRIASLSGDFNESLSRDRWKTLGALKTIALGFSAKTHGDADIDHWWFLKRQTKKRGFTYETEALRGYHSDHRPLLVRIYRPR